MREFAFEDPSPEELAFVEAICEAPSDYAPRLVYADWLEERDDPRSEIIRRQCGEEARREEAGLGYLLPPWRRWLPVWEGRSPGSIASAPDERSGESDPDRSPLRIADFWSDRLAPPRRNVVVDLLRGARWDGTTVRYSRRGGFVENLALASPSMLNQLPEDTFRRLPIRGFEFPWARGWNEALEDASVAGRIERLAVEFTYDSSALDAYRMIAWLRDFDVAVRVLHLSHVRSLGVGEWKRIFAALASTRVETISLEGCDLSPAFYRELHGAGEDFEPACLGLSGCGVREDGVRRLSTWPGLMGVRLLDLTDNRITRVGWEYLADSPYRRGDLHVLADAETIRAVPPGLAAVPVAKADRRRHAERSGPSL